MGKKFLISMAMLLVIGALTPSAAREPRATLSELAGTCLYKPELQRYAGETTLITCNEITVERGESAAFSFVQRSVGEMARFEGSMTGDRMAVTTVTLRDGVRREASGDCEIFYRLDGSLNVITCLAKPKGRQAVAANFVPSRI